MSLPGSRFDDVMHSGRRLPPRATTNRHDRVTGPAPSASGFAVLDLETTGLSPRKGARAIEIGLVLVAGDGTIEDRWETLVDPGGDPGPTHIHGVTRSMLDGAPAFADIAGDLASRLEGRAIVAHNAAFDVAFLDAEFAAAHLRWNRHPLCTMKLARRRGHYPANLEYLCGQYRIVNAGAHHALGDAVATAELLAHLEVTTDETPAAVTFPGGHPFPSGRTHVRPPA